MTLKAARPGAQRSNVVSPDELIPVDSMTSLPSTQPSATNSVSVPLTPLTQNSNTGVIQMTTDMFALLATKSDILGLKNEIAASVLSDVKSDLPRMIASQMETALSQLLGLIHSHCDGIEKSGKDQNPTTGNITKLVNSVVSQKQTKAFSCLEKKVTKN